MTNLIWIQSGTCAGDTMALADADEPGLIEAITKLGINVAFHPTLSFETGDEAMAILDRFAKGKEKLDVFVLEGSVILGPNGTGMYAQLGGRSLKDIIEELASVANIVVAVGTCASFGGVPATPPNPSESTGLQFHKKKKGGFLGAGFKSKAGLPVINISGCSTHPDRILHTLAAVILGKGAAIQLDEYNRPADFFKMVVHRGCRNNEYYDYAVDAEKFCDPGCLAYKLGCRGRTTFADCNIRLWNRHSSPTRVGAPCIACTEPDFPEGQQPFSERREAVKGLRELCHYLVKGAEICERPSWIRKELKEKKKK